MTSVKDGGGSAAPNKIDPLFVTQAARIVVKGMMDWGILPLTGDVDGFAGMVVNARWARDDCNGFRLACALDQKWGWAPYNLDARAVDMLSRLDAIAEEIQVQHQRQVEVISDAWAEMFGAAARNSTVALIGGSPMVDGSPATAVIALQDGRPLARAVAESVAMAGFPASDPTGA